MIWIAPLLVSSFTWGFCEVLSDVSIDDGDSNLVPLEGKVLNKLQRRQYARGLKLSGHQATLVSAFTMLPVAIIMHGFGSQSLFDFHDPATWLAMTAGIINAVSAQVLYLAYESASSTIIVPLAQLTAVFVVPLSTLVGSTSIESLS